LGLLIGVGAGKKRQEINRELMRGNYWEETVVGVDFGQRRKMTGGSHLSAREREREGAGTGSGNG
jgi:hypothetical protein